MASMNDVGGNGLLDNSSMQPPPLSEAEIRAAMLGGNNNANQYNQNRWFRKPSKCGVLVTALVMVILALIVFSPWMYRFMQMLFSSVGTSVMIVADGAPTYMGMIIQSIILFALYVGLEYLPDDYKLSNMVCDM